jgi:hypothetical protein
VLKASVAGKSCIFTTRIVESGLVYADTISVMNDAVALLRDANPGCIFRLTFDVALMADTFRQKNRRRDDMQTQRPSDLMSCE